MTLCFSRLSTKLLHPAQKTPLLWTELHLFFVIVAVAECFKAIIESSVWLSIYTDLIETEHFLHDP